MYKKSLSYLIVYLTLQVVQCEFNPKSNSNIIYYWGQNSAGVAPNDPEHKLWQKPLAHYCDGEDKDLIVISFLHQFGGNRKAAVNLANTSNECKGLINGTELLDCPQMEKDINYCQSKGIKVLLSMGGATPAYGIGTEKEGVDLAGELWDTFGGGSGTIRPFGNASVDGFDLDIENGEKAGYTAFSKRIRELYETDKSKDYYLAAAPQCPFPDYYVGEPLDNAHFDFVFIQFYNNFCSVINEGHFNYDEWDNWAKTKSINKDVRLFVGIPGSPSAAGRGYVPYTQLVSTVRPLQKLQSFGGLMVWDISQAYGNTEDVLPHYAHGIHRLVHSDDTSPIELAPETIKLGDQSSSTSNVISDLPSSSPSPSDAGVWQPSLINTVSSIPQLSSSTDIIPIIPTPNPPLPSSSVPLEAKATVCSTTYSEYITTIVSTASPSSPINSSVTEFISTPSVFTSTSTLNSTIVACSTPLAPVPVHGQPCPQVGLFQCSGLISFAQCSYAGWVVQACSPSLVCRENNATTPVAVYCDYA